MLSTKTLWTLRVSLNTKPLIFITLIMVNAFQLMLFRGKEARVSFPLMALLLVVLSGLIWFILWRNGSSFAGLALETHKNVTLLIELYLIGHGCMALLHFFVWQRNKARQE